MILLVWMVPIEVTAYIISAIDVVNEVLEELEYFMYTIYSVVLFTWGVQMLRAVQDIKYSRLQLEPVVRAVLAVVIFGGGNECYSRQRIRHRSVAERLANHRIFGEIRQSDAG